jgi:HK97 family phage prohead protease
MPWHIESDNAQCSGFAVVKDDGGDIEGCHKTEEEAKKQLAALYANEPGRSDSVERPPREGKRGIFPYELREEDASLPTMHGHFAVFNQWTEINSLTEGHFLERISPGAFKKTISESRDRIRVLFQHGQDPQVGDKILGPIEELREEEEGVFYEVPLLDTAYNRDLVPALRLKKNGYGASFRFSVDPKKEEFKRDTEKSAYNPKGLPERTIREAQLFEFGPVTFPAYEGATAGVRSLTDEFEVARLFRNPERLRQLIAATPTVDETALPTLGAEATHSQNGSRVTPPVTYPPVSLDDFVKRLTG